MINSLLNSKVLETLSLYPGCTFDFLVHHIGLLEHEVKKAVDHLIYTKQVKSQHFPQRNETFYELNTRNEIPPFTSPLETEFNEAVNKIAAELLFPEEGKEVLAILKRLKLIRDDFTIQDMIECMTDYHIGKRGNNDS